MSLRSTVAGRSRCERLCCANVRRITAHTACCALRSQDDQTANGMLPFKVGRFIRAAKWTVVRNRPGLASGGCAAAARRLLPALTTLPHAVKHKLPSMYLDVFVLLTQGLYQNVSNLVRPVHFDSRSYSRRQPSINFRRSHDGARPNGVPNQSFGRAVSVKNGAEAARLLLAVVKAAHTN